MELDSNNDSIFYDFVYFQKSITFCFYIILILFYALQYSNYCYNTILLRGIPYCLLYSMFLIVFWYITLKFIL